MTISNPHLHTIANHSKVYATWSMKLHSAHQHLHQLELFHSKLDYFELCSVGIFQYYYYDDLPQGLVRGEKFDIDALVETWDRVSLQTAWKLEDVYSFTDKELDPSVVSSGTLVNTAFIEKNYSLTPISTTTVSDNPSHNPDTIISPDEIIASNDSVLCILIYVMVTLILLVFVSLLL